LREKAVLCQYIGRNQATRALTTGTSLFAHWWEGLAQLPNQAIKGLRGFWCGAASAIKLWLANLWGD